MTAWAFTLCYNEALMIRYWVRHYRTFCEKVIVYVDLESDDGTAKIAKKEGAEVRPYSGSGHLDDRAFVEFAQEHYKEARGKADWVIWTDADEIVYHPHIRLRLADYKVEGVTLPKLVGYGMLAHSPPSGTGQIYDEIKLGIPADEYAKVAVFDPMLDVQWSAGKHDAYAPGAVRDDGTDPLKLLHYRWLGEAWFKERNRRNYSRLDEQNRHAWHGKETYPGYIGKYGEGWYVGQIDGAKAVI